MKKAILYLLIIVTFFSCFINTYTVFSKVAIDIYINGKRCSFDQMAVTLNERILVPMRGMFETLGAIVTWDALKNTVTGELDGTNIKVVIGKTDAYINGNKYVMDVPPQLVNGRTMIPSDFISDAFGAKIEWREDERAIYIDGIGKKGIRTAKAESEYLSKKGNPIIMTEGEFMMNSEFSGLKFGTCEAREIKKDLIYSDAVCASIKEVPPSPDMFCWNCYETINVGEENNGVRNLLLIFTFRTAKCDYSLGYGTVNVWAKNKDTGEKIIEKELISGSSWYTYYIPFTQNNVPVVFGVDFGYQRQDIEISQFKVVDYSNTPIEEVPCSVD